MPHVRTKVPRPLQRHVEESRRISWQALARELNSTGDHLRRIAGDLHIKVKLRPLRSGRLVWAPLPLHDVQRLAAVVVAQQRLQQAQAIRRELTRQAIERDASPQLTPGIAREVTGEEAGATDHRVAPPKPRTFGL